MIIGIKIQSVSDIITNSSSEVFLCQNNTDMSMNELVEFIYEYNRQHQYEGPWEDFRNMTREELEKYDSSGGMGGFLSVVTLENAEEDWHKHYLKQSKNPSKALLVDTDWCHRATINWIIENLNAINAEDL